MQKISSYLYSNRVILLANLAGFTVEYTNVYQRNVKIYNGIDNTIEFDIKNADQKRIDLATLPQIELNVMDAQGNALENSPYTVTPTALKGIAKVTIPQEDLDELSSQYLKYSVTAVSTTGADVLLYADTRFGAVGTMEVVGDAMPTFRDERVYEHFTQEIDLDGNVTNHTPAIASKFYEAEPVKTLDFEIKVTDFIGIIYLEATENSTISVNSYLNAPQIRTITTTVATTTTINFNDVEIGNYNYFRVTWKNGNYKLALGTVDKVVVS
jgi:hypothetical protein